MRLIKGSRDVEDGEVVFHMDDADSGNYGTVCGVSLDDDMYTPVMPEPGQKITCVRCSAIWRKAREYRATDFK